MCKTFVLALAIGLAATAAGAATDWTQAQVVTVRAVEYAFEPSRLEFRRGVPYHLQFVNRGKEVHEFTAPVFFQAIEIANPEALNSEHTQLAVQPGEAKDLYFIPRQAGNFPLSCADHDWAGMTGDITIE